MVMYEINNGDVKSSAYSVLHCTESEDWTKGHCKTAKETKKRPGLSLYMASFLSLVSDKLSS